MNRSFLLLPILAAMPIASTLADPAPTTKPKVVVPPGVKTPAPTKSTASTPAKTVTPAKAPVATPVPAKPKVVVPPAANVPQVKPPRIKPHGAPDGHEGHDHGTPGGETGTGKPADPVGDSLDYLWKQSDVAFHAGDYDTAVKIHRAIVTLDPTDTESYSVAAWLLWSMEKKTDARDFIAQGLNANPDSAEMWEKAADQYDIEKSYSDAKEAYLKAIALTKGKPSELLRRRLGHAAEHAGDLALSEQTWTDLVRDFPNSAVDKNNLLRVQGLRNKPIE